jgi:GT2 family glycosyltransferase
MITSISIVTYNSAAVIGECLANLDPNTPIFIYDNASTDNTVALIRENFPNVMVQSGSKNIGFGVAHNFNLQKITTPYALILNPDCFLKDADIAAMVNVLESFPESAISGPCYGGTAETGKLIKKTPDGPFWPEGPCCVAFISAACCMVRMDVMRRLGGYDDNIFMFFEDNDMCDRYRAAGHSLIITPFADVRHLRGGSAPKTKTRWAWRFYLIGWSHVYYLCKHNPQKRRRLMIQYIYKFLARSAKLRLEGQKESSKEAFDMFRGALSFAMGQKTQGRRYSGV